ncbi:N utilization substance protein B [Thermobispora bispora]|uniref:Transcription antitermination protein NusB n=1 Tax=Thermobispora bispora (strain ATCC 19993 / DSM 43833 / CBS 139.67 / JCM 10125 / KCTC 9307 / NBRC 14880 / R51) TaxID=469371 RepID=D6Y9I9_THEBD|nr:transcription antitermination factor NusB [Thermobispora bispora]MBO2474009.1 transcription antitermination factor NusB [Actinomycetales bacterium]MDI9580332.1 transcription antitermination factor NusB [Thermobispora sp.]ADG88109.1 NusB antitermination factor [Thermobispora bispora DSM 43833]MBX6167751.1 transcription antitermination factor NusB [Thermobispora bispora]QSI47966.1 transcription antitermination factor NusB [Thermobispora bispora]
MTTVRGKGRQERTQARQRALDILFEAEARAVSPLQVLDERAKEADPPVLEYTVTLVEGVVRHQDRIDELISTYAQGWTLDRMPAVDRNILRAGTYEMLWSTDVPENVVISEWVRLAAELSTDESPHFVNGLLARFKELKPSLTI